MQIQSVAILVNPIAGKGKSSKMSVWLHNELNKKTIPNTIFSNEWPTLSILETFSDVWVVGGDGTINYFINHYPNCKIPIALFSGGTGNDFAWKLYKGISKEVQFSSLFNASPKPVDAGKVNDTLYINCLGVGFDGEILESMKAIRFIGGHFGYLLAVIYKIFRFKEKSMTIRLADEEWNEKFLLVLIVNSSRAGGGFNIAPPADVNDGQLNIWKRLRYLPIIKKGNHLHYPFIVHKLGKEFTINSNEILPIQIDGELQFTNKLQVSVLPKQFLFRY
jgi:diacylglycerol kinase (ATP)